MSHRSRKLQLVLVAVLTAALFLSVAALAAVGKGKPGKPGKGKTPSAAQYQYGKQKVTLCHKGKTITVGAPAAMRLAVDRLHGGLWLGYVDGGISQSVFSFDSPLTRMGYVEITGTEGTMIIPDPNMFTGEVKIARAPAFAAIADEPLWESVPITGAHAERGLGVLDLARAARTGVPPLASGELGFHVLDTLVAIDEAINEHRVVTVDSRVDRVPLVADHFDPFTATL